MEPRRFFFYGTLISGGRNPAVRAAHARLRPVGEAFLRGRLAAIPNARGWYPALLDGDDKVAGMVFEALPSFDAEDLARLDAYEDFDPARPDRSLYLRVAVSVEFADGATAEVQAYRFNRALPAGAQPIECGDFAAWLDAGGRTSFGE